jgi:hypothetical protein
MGLFSRELKDAINQTKKIKICGVKFIIKKVDVLDHLKGSSAINQTFETYNKEKNSKDSFDINFKKLKQHYVDIFMSSILSPKISADKKEGYVDVNDFFNNWDLCSKLYNEIILFTYGKKKLKLFGYQDKG